MLDERRLTKRKIKESAEKKTEKVNIRERRFCLICLNIRERK